MSGFKTKWLLAVSVVMLSFNVVADEVYQSEDALALPASQSAPLWRVRGALGLASINVDSYDQAPALDLAVQKTIDEQVAIELGYEHFNDFDHSSLDQSIGGDVMKLSVVGYSTFIEQHRYFFRLGAFRSDFDWSASESSSNTDVGFFGGFGVSFKIAPQLSVTTELNQLYAASVAEADINVTQILLGLEYEI